MRLAIKDCSDDAIDLRDASISPAKDWESYYEAEANAYSSKLDWWTLSCWGKHLVSELPRDLSGKMVVDFGCGTGDRVANLLPMDRHRYKYVGIDYSFDALKRAARNFPSGFLIRGDLGSDCLRPAVADVVLCLGVLMYFPNYAPVLDQCLSVLRPGGFLLLHEQINRISWSQMLGSGQENRNERLARGYGVRLQHLKLLFAGRGVIRHMHLAGSPIRRPTRKLLDVLGLEMLNPVGASMDSVWCASIGRVLPALGAAEVQIVFQKA